jgi:methyl-accepting chemotaxis protein
MPGTPQAATRTPSRRVGDLPIGARIGSALGILVLVTIAVATVGIVRLGALDSRVEELGRTAIEPQTYLVNTQRWFQASRARVLEYGMVDPSQRAEIEQQRADYDADALENIEAYGPYVLDAEAYATLQDAYARYQSEADGLMALADEGATAYHTAYAGSVRGTTTEIGDAMQALTDSVSAKATQDVADSSAIARSATLVMIAAGIAGVLLAIGLVVVLVRRIVRDLGRVQGTVEAIGRGDLTVSVDLDTRDELGRMAGSLNDAQGSLRSLMSGVVGTAQTVAAAASRRSRPTPPVPSGRSARSRTSSRASTTTS